MSVLQLPIRKKINLPGPHQLHHLLLDELWRGSTGYERGGDDDVALLALLGEQFHLGGDEFRGHLLRVPAFAFARFLNHL